ncbi:MAG: PadR family transcriptional regulator [Desulfurococcales archaeon]|nr:PadR family transcriptional regulator [Desulfurococcales archaeon]
MTVENLWMYVLAALSEGPTYAYDIRKRIARDFGFKPSTITLYSVVYRLKREGLIRERGDGFKVYEVTDEGVEALREGVRFIEENARRIREKFGERNELNH